MGYHLPNPISERKYPRFSLEGAALEFIREGCEGLRFDQEKSGREDGRRGIYLGTSLREGEIPYNMQMDIDRLCLENALDGFLKSGKKEDAFNVYFCYLEMFIGDYEKVRRMIELLSEFEVNGSELLMKHRDHYSHSVYVFALGLAIYQSNSVYRKVYSEYYSLKDEHQAACHYLEYWGLAALFHDIGYPFELPFEQAVSYFEVEGVKRENRPFMVYDGLEPFVSIDEKMRASLGEALAGKEFATTDQLFAHLLWEKLGEAYSCTEEQIYTFLCEKPRKPNKFHHCMDHAYFSATVLLKRLAGEMECRLRAEHLDALTAVLLHNSLYKYSIVNYKGSDNKPFQAGLHPLAYMLMLCDELQCWNRTSYGRNTKKEMYPMGCTLDLSQDAIRAVYLFDEKEIGKINRFKDSHIWWLSDLARRKKDPDDEKEKENAPELKAYSEMYIKNSQGICRFQEEIERIVDLSEIRLHVETGLSSPEKAECRSYLSESNFIHLYNFAVILNGRWNNEDWKRAKLMGREEDFLNDEQVIKRFGEAFKKISLEYKLLNINQAKAFARYMDAIGCFYTDKDVDFELVEGFSEEELVKIGLMEHQRWLQEHYDMGWIYGEPEKEKRDLSRTHRDMIPGFDAARQQAVSDEQARENYERLDKAEQDKDTDPMECMLAMLRMFDGLRIYRL